MNIGAHIPALARQLKVELNWRNEKSFIIFETATHIKPVIRPTSKLHLAVLVVEGEPGDVNLAGGHEDAGRDVGAQPLVRHHHICRVGSVKGLTRTEIMESRLRTHTYFLGY